MNLKDLKGVGQKTYEILRSKGIKDIPSLLTYIPSSYKVYKLTPLVEGEIINVIGMLTSGVSVLKLKNAKKISFSMAVEGIIVQVVLFNQEYLKKTIDMGDEVVVIGKYDNKFRTITATKVIKRKDYKEGIFPDYNIDGINNPSFQRIVKEAVEYYKEKELVIPTSYFDKYGYLYGKRLLLAIHFPELDTDNIKALQSLKYYELVDYSIRMGIIRKNLSEVLKKPKDIDLDRLREFTNTITSFELTKDQKESVNEIYLKMKSNHPLNMLLEGDVGSGKTIVAIISCYMNYLANYQSLVIAPTEALAQQHFKTFSSYLSKFNVNVKLLTSSTKAKEREEILDGLKKGIIDIIIGTTSLLSDEVSFENLGFIVCDEQHKFGVNQRKIIREKGINPDVLYTTATPIPRTLSLTLFGDMDLKTIKTLPVGKKPIETKICSYREYVSKVLPFVEKEINEGRQAYFVSPLIDSSENSELTSVKKVESDLKTYFKSYNIGLLHGRLDPISKMNVINDFINKKIDILASTSVIEVGINNPNASVMVIIDAHNFGLSSIHQLRGRVGRGTDNGYCFLMISNSTEKDKLKILEETQDGFRISEEDLRQRGPGDFLGVNQSGSLKFRFADIFKDDEIFSNALADSKELIKDDNIVEYYQNHLYNDNFD